MARTTDAAMVDRLVREFGAKVLLETALVEPHGRNSKEVADERSEVAVQVGTCRQCTLYAKCNMPVWAEWGTSEYPQVTVIGDSPGPQEDKHEQPFVGPSGKLIRHEFRAQGLTDVTYMNTVSCFPNVDGRVRPPAFTESYACRKNLFAQLEASNSKYVVLAGNSAVQAWRSELKISKVVNKLFVWNDRWLVYPIFHPSYVLRNRTDPQVHMAWVEGIRKFADIVTEDLGLLGLSSSCIKCGVEMKVYDKDGVPWCGQHYAEGIIGWKKTKKFWSEPMEGQEAML